MAEISAAQLEAFAQAMTQAQARVGGLDGAISALRARIDGLNRSMRGVMDDASNARADAAAASAAKKRFLNEQSQIASAYQQGRVSHQRASQMESAARERFADSMDSVGDNLKTSLGGISSALNGSNSQLFQLTENTKRYNGVQNQTISGLLSLAGYSRSLVESYQRGSSGLNDMSMALDATKVGFTMIGNLLTNTGASIAGAFGPLRGVRAARQATGDPASSGSAISGLMRGLGGGLQALGGIVASLAKNIFPIFANELQSAYETYNRMATAGGLFTNGLMGMLNAAQGVGLTIGELTEVVANNRDALAGMGIGIGDAAKAMGEIGKMIPAQVTNRLRMLGINAKDQADAMIDVMRDMRTSRGFDINNKQNQLAVAKQTEVYAENLRTLAAITGEDAKRKTEETRRANMVLGFQQKLSNLDPTAISNINLGMATMSKEMAQAVREQTVFGRIVTPELAAQAQAMPAFGDAIREAAQSVQDGSLTQEKALAIQAKNSEAMQDQALRNTALGRAGMAPGADPLVRGMTENMASTLERARRITRESVRNVGTATKNLTGNGPGTDTTTAMTEAAQAGRDFALMIQKELLGEEGPMKLFAEGVRDMTTVMGAAIRMFTNPSPPQLSQQPPTGTPPATPTSDLMSALSERLTGIFRDAGNIIAETIGRALGTTPPRQLAMGGIISGDPRGFLATLHGNEAVIPLPDNIRGPEFAQAMQNLLELETAKKITPDMATSTLAFSDAFEKVTRPVAQDQIEILTNIKNLMEEMVNHSRNIADHTELTAVRVS